MKNLFELAPFLRRLENNRAKCAPIQLPICIKNVAAKFLTNLPEHGLVIMRQLAGHCISIEKLRFRQKLTQAINKSRFARGNSAGDPDRWHGKAEHRHSCRCAKQAFLPVLFSSHNGLKVRWAHRLQAYVPGKLIMEARMLK